MKIELCHTTSELKQLFRKEKDPRLAIRIRAVYLGLMDKSAPEIAVLLGFSRRTIQNWISIFVNMSYISRPLITIRFLNFYYSLILVLRLRCFGVMCFPIGAYSFFELLPFQTFAV